MLERVIENWLDSSSERSYQSVFCQMLIAQGYTIIHSTRHSPLEMGKDVIARDSNGKLHAYQLKGNPGSRLTLNQFRAIQPQIIQLVSQSILHPNTKHERHLSYLVTNGEVDEEAQQAAKELSEGFRMNGFLEPELRIISRGQLLKWANQLGYSLWPSELADLNTLLELMIYNGKDIFPIEKAHKLFKKLLYLDSTSRTTSPEIIRRINSCGILTGILLKNFQEENNHYAIITAWTAYYAYVIASVEKHHLSAKKILPSLNVAKDTIFDSLNDLANEVFSRKYHTEGNALADIGFYHARTTLLTALVSTLWLWIDAEKISANPSLINDITNFVHPPPNDNLQLWGEAAVPQWLAYYWYIRKNNATMLPDMLLGELTSSIVTVNASNSKNLFFASPYYSIEDVIKHKLHKLDNSIAEDPLKDTHAGMTTYTAEGLLHLLCRTLHKQTCKAIWPSFSKLGHAAFIPDTQWEYCLWRSESGREKTIQRKNQISWRELCQEARNISTPEIPEHFRAEPILLLLFIIIFPHRAIPSVIRFLGYTLNRCWFIDKPIDRRETEAEQ